MNRTFKKLEPPPSMVKLVPDVEIDKQLISNQGADTIWKNWFNNARELINFLRGDRKIELQISLSAVKAGGVNDPVWTKAADDGAGSTGVYIYAFPGNNERELFLTMHFGHHYTEGSDVDVNLHWTASDATPGNVVWGLEYTWVNVGDPPGNTTTLTATVASPGSSVHIESELFTISGTGKTRQSIMMGRFFRKAVDAADTYASDAYANTLDLHSSITIDNES